MTDKIHIGDLSCPMENNMALSCVDFADVKHVFVTHFECERIYHIDEPAFVRSLELAHTTVEKEMSNVARAELEAISHWITTYRRGYFYELTPDQEWNLAFDEAIKGGTFELSKGTTLRPYKYKVIAQVNDNERLEIIWFDFALDLNKPLREIIAPRLKHIEYKKHVRYLFDNEGKL